MAATIRMRTTMLHVSARTRWGNSLISKAFVWGGWSTRAVPSGAGEPLPPSLAGRAAFRGRQKVLERDVDEGHPRFGEELARVPELPADVDPPPLLLLDPAAHRERPIDRHGPAVAKEDAAGHGREAVPGGEKTARLVEECGDEAAMDEARTALVTLVEGEPRLVAVGTFLLGRREVKADRVVAAAEAGRVVVRGDLQRRPPRSKCALKKFSEPEVAIAAEAEISSASVAAATICANR